AGALPAPGVALPPGQPLPRRRQPGDCVKASPIARTLVPTCLYRMKFMNMTASSALTLHPGKVTLADLRRIHAGPLTLALDSAARAGMQASQATVQRIVDEDQVVYGINTGFGKLASTKIAHDRLAELQRNLVLSHSVGTGDPLPDDVVRLILATKAVSLARGHSGVRPELVDALLAL